MPACSMPACLRTWVLVCKKLPQKQLQECVLRMGLFSLCEELSQQ